MRLFKKILVVVPFCLSLLAVQATAETKVAVMNYQAVLFNSVAANDATLKLRTLLEPQQKTLVDIQKQLETRQTRLQTDKDILTEEELKLYQSEIQQLLNGQAQVSNQMQQAQQESRNAFVKEYQPVVRDFVSDYVKANGFTLVLDSQVVLWNESEPDISENILDSFDEWYKKQNNTSELSGS